MQFNSAGSELGPAQPQLVTINYAVKSKYFLSFYVVENSWSESISVNKEIKEERDIGEIEKKYVHNFPFVNQLDVQHIVRFLLHSQCNIWHLGQ